MIITWNKCPIISFEYVLCNSPTLLCQLQLPAPWSAGLQLSSQLLRRNLFMMGWSFMLTCFEDDVIQFLRFWWHASIGNDFKWYGMGWFMIIHDRAYIPRFRSIQLTVHPYLLLLTHDRCLMRDHGPHRSQEDGSGSSTPASASDSSDPTSDPWTETGIGTHSKNKKCI